MLTIIVLLLDSEFKYETNNITIFIKKGPLGVSAKINLFGVAAWGYNNVEENFAETIEKEIQKVLTYNVEGRRELLKAYEDRYHLLQRRELWSKRFL